MTCAVAGLRPGVEQLREVLHPNTPGRCWGPCFLLSSGSLPSLGLPAANLPHFPLMKCPCCVCRADPRSLSLTGVRAKA